MNTSDEQLTKEKLGSSGPLSDEVTLPPSPDVPGIAVKLSGQLVQHLADQLAEARCKKELARLDLEWEIERRQFLIVSGRTPSGEVPKHSTALAFHAVGAAFALGMALLVINSSAGLWLLLLFAPLVALTVFIIAAGVQQYSRASRYQKALARYESRRGSITPTVFKPAIVTGCSSSSEAGDGLAAQQLADQVAEARYQAELARLDKEWQIEQQKHYIRPRRGKPYLPTTQDAIVAPVLMLAVGLLLLFSAVLGLVVFGVFMVVIAVGGGIHCYCLAKDYERALSAYQTRRKNLSPKQFRIEPRLSDSSTGVA